MKTNDKVDVQFPSGNKRGKILFFAFKSQIDGEVYWTVRVDRKTNVYPESRLTILEEKK